MGVEYSKVVPILVEGMKEQQELINKQNDVIDRQQKQIDDGVAKNPIEEVQHKQAQTEEQLKQVMKRFSEIFATDVIGTPEGIGAITRSARAYGKLTAVNHVSGICFILSIDDAKRLSKTEHAKQIKL